MLRLFAIALTSVLIMPAYTGWTQERIEGRCNAAARQQASSSAR
jgi:hypothetical protein